MRKDYRRNSLPLFFFHSASLWKYLGCRLNRTHMLRRALGKGTSAVVRSCGQTVSFWQEGLWQHNGSVVGRTSNMPVTCGQGLPKLDKASEKHVVTFYIKLVVIKENTDVVLTQFCFKIGHFKWNRGVGSNQIVFVWSLYSIIDTFPSPFFSFAKSCLEHSKLFNTNKHMKSEWRSVPTMISLMKRQIRVTD